MIRIENHSFYSPHLNISNVVLDLGANTGDFSKYLISIFGVTCFAVEMEQNLVRKYQDKILDYSP